MVILNVDPNTPPLSWKRFTEKKPAFSVALDGYVAGPPKFMVVPGKGPYRNLNHHEGVSRSATRATCAQALLDIDQGIFKTFCDTAGELQAHLWVNDCDEDVCLSVFLLRHSRLVPQMDSSRLDDLVHIADLLDTTAGAYSPRKHLPALSEINWVFQPYREFRISGNLDRRIALDYERVINDVGVRIEAFIKWENGKVTEDIRHRIIHDYGLWCMVEEVGANAKLGLFQKGRLAFVSVRRRPDGRNVYTICRQSHFIPFYVPDYLEALNEAEKCPLNDRWGGGITIGGSPRVSGSSLSPEEVAQIIINVTKDKQQQYKM
jgi:hypothetical protein